jgi:hypothetical protein
MNLMKLFFLGGVPEGCDEGAAETLAATMGRLGAAVVGLGHDVVVCSPYEGSIDREIVRGASSSQRKPAIEIHFPDNEEIGRAVRDLGEKFSVELQCFRHAPSTDTSQGGATYAWLLSQLFALDAAHVVVAAGGNLSGSANMLLHLAEARGKPVLALGHLGGAAARYLERQRYAFRDALGELEPWLHRPEPMDDVGEILERLADVGQTRAVRGDRGARFFLSYPRDRQAEADLAETIFRRRGLTLLRDDLTFDPSGELQGEITRAIRSSDVFVALWSSGYACSPWCHDEMELALQLRDAGKIDIWLLQLDDTRVVPRGARGIVAHPGRSRDEFQANLIGLIERRT